MKQIFLLINLLLAGVVNAQYTSINLPYPSDVCANNNYMVGVYSGGLTVGANITIELSNNDFATKTIIGNGNYTGNYPENISCLIPAATTAGTNYKVRAVVTGVPAFNIYTSNNFSVVTGTVGASLSGTYSFEACGSGTNLPINFTGNGPYNFSYQRNSETPINQTSTNSPYSLSVYQDGTYKLLSVSNACGAGTVSVVPNNSASVTVTPPILTIGTPSDINICMGNKIYVPFTSSQSCYGYTVQISDETGNNFRDLQTDYDYNFPNRLTATIADIGQEATTGYKLRIKITVNAVVYVSSASVATLTLKRKPTLSAGVVDALDYYNPNQIAKGENVKIQLSLTGTAPWIVNYENTVLKITTNTYNLQVSPSTSHKYMFGPVSDASGCVNSFEQNVDITVKDLIFKMRINDNKNLDIYSHFRNFCRSEFLHVDYNVRGIMPIDSFKVQIASVNDLDNNIEDWKNVNFYKTANDDALDVEIPLTIKSGRNRLRFLPKNATLLYTNTTVDFINDYFTPSSDFIIMDKVTGKMTGDSVIKINPNESFYLNYQFSGGPDYYANNLGSLKPYKPLLLTDKGQTIDYGNLLIGGFNSLTGNTRVDTVTKNIVFKLVKINANTAASGDISCQTDNVYQVIDSLKVVIIPTDLTRSITVGDISGLSNLCGGTNVTIPFTKTGTFNIGTTYQVQLQEYSSIYASNPLSNFYDVPTAPYTTPNQLTFTIPNKAGTYQTSYYKIRIVTISPNLIGAISSQWLTVSQQPPYVELKGDAYVEAGESANIQIKAGYSPNFNFNIEGGGWTSTLLSSYNYSISNFQNISVNTLNTAVAGSQINFHPVNASSSCGNGVYVGKGVVNIVATPKIVLSSPVPATSCQPAKLIIPFSSDLIFTDENKFSVKVWTNYYGYEYVISNTSIKKIGNSFEVGIPNQALSTTYYIKVFSSSPYATSTTQIVVLRTTPSASATPYSAEVEMGSNILLTYNLSDGTQPYSFIIDKGDKKENVTGSFSSYSYSITPQFSKNFYLTNLSDLNCLSVAAAPSQQITVIEKKQAIEIASINFSQLCASTPIAVPFIYEGSYTAFKLQISDANGQNYVDISTSQSGNTLNGTIPVGLIAGTNYRIRIKGESNGGNVFSLPNNIGLTVGSGSLTATISGNQNILKDNNNFYFTEQAAILRIDFTGTGPYKFNLFDGTISTAMESNENPLFIRVKPTSTITYTIQNLSNECSSGTVAGSATVNVVYLETGLASTRVCYGQTISAPFTPTGTFSPSTNYYIDLYYIVPYDNARPFSSNIYSLPATLVGNTLQATIPNTIPLATGYDGFPNVSVYWVRVRSSNPTVVGSWSTNGGTAIGELNPTVKILGSTNILSGESATLSLETNKLGAGISVTLNDGISNETISFSGMNLPFNKYPTTTTTYTITGVTTGCGTGTVGSPNSVTITVGPCPPNQSITLTHTFGQEKKYETSGIINANNQIQNGAKITYDAQKAIILNTGFQAGNGSIFKAYIDGCGNR